MGAAVTRAYIRLIPDVYERKVLGIRGPDEPPGTRYSPAAFSAFIATMTFSEMVSPRGRFKSRRVLEALLAGPDDQGADIADQVPFLIEQGDLEQQPDGSLYFEGWDELQEGRDPSVNDRMARYRRELDRKRGTKTSPSQGYDDVTRNSNVTDVGVTAKSRPPLTAKRLTAKKNGVESLDGASNGRSSTPTQMVRQWLVDHGSSRPTGYVNTDLNDLVRARGHEPVIAA